MAIPEITRMMATDTTSSRRLTPRVPASTHVEDLKDAARKRIIPIPVHAMCKNVTTSTAPAQARVWFQAGGAWATAGRPEMGRRKAPPRSVFVFFLLLLVFVFLAANFGEALAERSLGEQIGGEAGIVFANGEEDLAGTAAVAVGGDLHGGAHAVHQLEIGVDVGFDIAVAHGLEWKLRREPAGERIGRRRGGNCVVRSR